MRSVDLTPLSGLLVGFENRLDQLFDMAFRNSAQDNAYPPYNIVKTGDDSYKITLAVAGFGEDDLEKIVAKENLLTVQGRGRRRPTMRSTCIAALAGGPSSIASSSPTTSRTNGASLVNGLLDIQLVGDMLEAKKPQQIKDWGPPSPA